MRKQLFWITILTAMLILSGCDVKNGVTSTTLDLPTDTVLDLYSADEGIYPNTDIRDNPDNPFRDAALNMDNVWDFNDICPSAKSKFYLWGTMLTIVPMGEYQYMTAQALHELYTTGGSVNAREQAKRAYRATLDHFFDSVTWWNAWWIDEDTYYAVLVRTLVGQAMYDPTEINLLPLYDDPALALEDLSEWGYIYDQESGTLSRWE